MPDDAQFQVREGEQPFLHDLACLLAAPTQAWTRRDGSIEPGGGAQGIYVGDTRIVSPMGELLGTAAGVETIVLADVDAAEVAATRDHFRFLPDRR